jgi:phosphate transport system substrate-binding protein
MRNFNVILVLLLLLSGSCRFFRGNPYNNTATTGITSICSDETFRPVIEAEVQVFKAIYGYTVINTKYVPEGEAFDQLLKDSVQLIIASRQLTGEETGVLNKMKLYPKQMKIATDAIALIVNPSNPDSLITVSQIRDILTGKISRWNQLNPKASSDPIRVIFDNEKSSIVNFLVDSICKGKFDKSNVFALDYNRDVIEYTATHSDVLGFIGVSWISNSEDSLHLSFHKRIKVMAVSQDPLPNVDNSYKPYQAYMVNNIYPLTRSIYMINSEPRTGLATGFSAFLASDKGQRIILKSGILPDLAPTRVVNIRKEL